RVRYDDFAAAHVLDSPRGVAQKKDVAAVRFHGEIFVHGADERAGLIVGDHSVGRYFRDRAAAGDRRQPRSLAGVQPAVDAIALYVRAESAALGRDALADHI